MAGLFDNLNPALLAGSLGLGALGGLFARKEEKKREARMRKLLDIQTGELRGQGLQQLVRQGMVGPERLAGLEKMIQQERERGLAGLLQQPSAPGPFPSLLSALSGTLLARGLQPRQQESPLSTFLERLGLGQGVGPGMSQSPQIPLPPQITR